MINPVELRLGNWLLKNEEEPVHVACIGSLAIGVWQCLTPQWQYGETDQPECSLLALNMLSPIPINQEWINKLGIGKENDFGEREILIGGSVPMLLEGYRICKNSTRGFTLDREGEALVTLVHIHQLQNIIFALSGHELEMKEI